MFQHVVTLFSFIFALALTDIFESVSDLMRARRRVRLSWLQALWMVSASLLLLINWLSIWQFELVSKWTAREILLQLTWVVPQYFTCSLIALKVGDDDEVVDMEAFFERQRPMIFGAFVILYVASMVVNYLDRDNIEGWGPNDWIGANLLILPMLLTSVVAGWAKPRWLQWLAALVSLGMQGWFLMRYAVT